MGPDVELREAVSASGPVCHFLRSRRCPKFSDAAPPTGASRACGDPIETTAAGSEFRPRQGFVLRTKRLDGACAPPHLRWGPDVELREAASISGPVYHFLRSRRCPKFSGAAPPTGAERACGDPIEKPRPEVNSDRGKVLPIGQNAWTARARRPICDGAPTWSCGRRRPYRGPFVIFLEECLPTTS